MVFLSHSFPQKALKKFRFMVISHPPSWGCIVKNYAYSHTRTNIHIIHVQIHSTQRFMYTFFHLLRLQIMGTKPRIPLYSSWVNGGKKNSYGHVWNENFPKGMENSVNAPQVQRFISYDLSLGFIWSAFLWEQGLRALSPLSYNFGNRICSQNSPPIDAMPFSLSELISSS